MHSTSISEKNKYKLKNITIHDEYSNAKPYRDQHGLQLSNGYYFDIAIAELESPVKNVEPASLYTGNSELNQRAIMAGYGYVEKSNDYAKEETLYVERKTGGENMIDSIGLF